MDGLDDQWEYQHFAGLSQSADDDPDGEGLANLREFQKGSDPNSSDTDGDGTSDSKEIDAGRNPLLNEPAAITIINSALLDD